MVIVSVFVVITAIVIVIVLVILSLNVMLIAFHRVVNTAKTKRVTSDVTETKTIVAVLVLELLIQDALL